MRKKLVAILLAAVTTVAMVGCGASGTDTAADTAGSEEGAAEAESEDAQEAASDSSEAAADDNTITVCVTNGPGAQEAWTALADAYMEKHPEIMA